MKHKNVLDYTINDILKLTYRAGADVSALEELQRISYRMSDNANRRIKTFQKNNINSPAYNIASSFLTKQNRKSFTKSKKLSISDMRDNILNARKFLTAKTGTVKGYHEYQNDNLERIENRTGLKIDPDKIDIFEEFLKSDFFKQYNDYDSDSSFQEGINLINAGLTLSELNSRWNDFLNDRNESILDVWEDLKDKYDITDYEYGG